MDLSVVRKITLLCALDDLQVLREDGGLVFCRGWRNDTEGGRRGVLIVHAISGQPTRAIVERLIQEYSLKQELDGTWAVRPLDQAGKRVGSTGVMFTATNGGGRAEPVLMSVAEMDYPFHVKNVVVVHHSFCRTTAFTPEIPLRQISRYNHADISTLFDQDSVAITDYEKSINYEWSCFARARQSRNMSSSTASSTRSIPAS